MRGALHFRADQRDDRSGRRRPGRADAASSLSATLYRHINALARAGAIAVVEERPARGTPERVYALIEGAGEVSRGNLTREDHLRYFTMFLAGLIGDFGRYLSRANADFVADGVGYRQVPLELTDQELAELTGRLNAALAPALDNRPNEDRERRTLTTIVMPAAGGRST